MKSYQSLRDAAYAEVRRFQRQVDFYRFCERASRPSHISAHQCERPVRALTVSNGFAENGGGGDASCSVSLPSSRSVAAKEDDDGGDPDPDPEPEPEPPRSPHYPSSPALLSLKAVSGRGFLSHSHIYSLIREGLFPAPVKIGRTSRWVAFEIDAWIASCIQQRSASCAR